MPRSTSTAQHRAGPADGTNLGTLAAGAHTLSFVAGGSGWQGGTDESLALDDIKVTGTVVAVPEPASLAPMLAGLGTVGLVGARRRRRN